MVGVGSVSNSTEDVKQTTEGSTHQTLNNKNSFPRDPFASPDDPDFPSNFLRQDTILIRKKAGESFSKFAPDLLVLPKERTDLSLGTLGELRHHSRTGSKSHVKKFVRRHCWGIGHRVRSELWKELCRNSAFTANMNIYRESSVTLKTNCRPSMLSSSEIVLNDWDLTREGKLATVSILTVVEIIKPDVTCVPIVYSLTSLLLHYMNADEVFACIIHLLGEKQKFLMQTDVTIAASKRTILTLVKRHAHGAYVLLRKLLGTTDDDQLMLVFDGWKKWLFRDLPFHHACRMVDCFLNEGQKVLFRFAVVIVHQWHKHEHRKFDTKRGPLKTPRELHEQISQFTKNMPLKPQTLVKMAFSLRNLKMSHIRKLQDKYRHLELEKRKNDEVDEGGREELTSNSSQHNLRAMYARHQFSTLQIESDILTVEQFISMEAWFPPVIQLKTPMRLFSSVVEGISFVRLWQKMADFSPTLFVFQTNNDEVFGAFCSGSFYDKGKVTYFGTGESFVFTILPIMQCYPWVGKDGSKVTHKQELFMSAEDKSLVIGGGSGQSICIRETLENGRCEACDTFANPPLVNDKEFTIKVMEVFCFINDD